MSTKKKLKDSRFNRVALSLDEIEDLQAILDKDNFDEVIDILANEDYYSLKMIKSEESLYNLIIGERSNGKTLAVLIEMLIQWVLYGKQGAYIRRYDEEIIGNKGRRVFSSIVSELDLVNLLTNGEYTDIDYRGREWFFIKYDDDTGSKVAHHTPFAYAFSINQAEHHKGTSFPDIYTILFDEFLTRDRYILNEYVEFSNLLSTIIRNRDGIIIYMLGNTVNQYSPYFDEMGIEDVRSMKQGQIHTYVYGEDVDGPTLSIEYTSSKASGKDSDKYFAFDNPKLRMITEGSWELPMYPHAPMDLEHENVIEQFFIEYKEDLVQGDIYYQDEALFIFFHVRTYGLEDDDERMQYRLEHSPHWNHATSLTSKHRNKLSAKIGELILKDLVFYQDNRIGELIRNYRMESEAYTIMNF